MTVRRTTSSERSTYAVARLHVLRARGDSHGSAARGGRGVRDARASAAPWPYASEASRRGRSRWRSTLGDVDEALSGGSPRWTHLDGCPPDSAPPGPAAPGSEPAWPRRAGRLRAGRCFTARPRHLRELGLPFHLAVAQLEHAEWLASHGRDDEAQPAARRGARDVRAARRPPLARAGRASVSAAERVSA